MTDFAREVVADKKEISIRAKILLQDLTMYSLTLQRLIGPEVVAGPRICSFKYDAESSPSLRALGA